MRRRLTTKRGRRLYEQRRWMIEPVFGQIKENRGIRRFQRRGFQAGASEWQLIAATHNLRKLYRHTQPHGSPAPFGRRSPRPRTPACPARSNTAAPTSDVNQPPGADNPAPTDRPHPADHKLCATASARVDDVKLEHATTERRLHAGRVGAEADR